MLCVVCCVLGCCVEWCGVVLATDPTTPSFVCVFSSSFTGAERRSGTPSTASCSISLDSAWCSYWCAGKPPSPSVESAVYCAKKYRLIRYTEEVIALFCFVLLYIMMLFC